MVPPCSEHDRDKELKLSVTRPVSVKLRSSIPIAKNPQFLDFEEMYEELKTWQQLYKSSYVPRYCFDAPVLGCWVRWMRRRYKEGRLESWKVERLNRLAFDWTLTNAEAKWYHYYHQLRRYKHVHGHTRIPHNYQDRREYDWVIVARWLRRQGKLLAKEKLSSHRREMLRALGVDLMVREDWVQRYSRLRALNGHERKLERRRWRTRRLEATAARAAQVEEERSQEAALQLQNERESQRREMARRALVAGYREVSGYWMTPSMWTVTRPLHELHADWAGGPCVPQAGDPEEDDWVPQGSSGPGASKVLDKATDEDYELDDVLG